MIIFGSSKMAKLAIDYFGKNNVSFLCDNNALNVGTYVDGIEVISFDELKNKHHNERIVIGANKGFVPAIEKQLKENGFVWYIGSSDLINWIEDKSSLDEFFDKWTSDSQIEELRVRVEANVEVHKLRQQVEFFKKHVDITTIKPATGELRKSQIEILEFTKRLCDICDKLDIKPFLDFGNLLGAVRHGGYVPWDDDMDVSLMRRDYIKLLEYFSDLGCLHMSDSNIEFTTNNYCQFLGDDLNRIVACRTTGQTKIVGYNIDKEVVQLDLWAYDFVHDGITEEDYAHWAEGIREKTKEMSSIKKKLDYMDKCVSEGDIVSINETAHIYPGIDNCFLSDRIKHKDSFIPTEGVFPLKMMKYETEQFWAPKDSHAWLKIEYNDYMSFPDDVGVEKHAL